MSITNGYGSLAQLKTQKGINDSIDDSILELALGAGSRQIDGVTGWRFWQDGTAVARTFFPTCRDELFVCDDDADGAGISTTTGLIVKLDTDDDGTFETTLTINTDFLLRPTNAAARVPVWPYTTVELTGLNYWFSRSTYRRPTIQITAKWGWPAIPDDITQACLLQAQMLASGKDAAFGVAALASIDGAGIRALPWNPLARALVAPYSRPAVG